MQAIEEQEQQDNLILNLSENEKLCLDAYLFNSSNRIAAYKVFKGITKDIDAVQLNSRASQWINNRSCKAYLTKNKRIVIDTGTQVNEHNENNMLNKEQIVTAMTQLVRTSSDPKLKSDLLIKLSTLQGFNKEQPKQDSETIRYYLPQRCESCDYKNKFNV